MDISHMIAQKRDEISSLLNRAPDLEEIGTAALNAKATRTSFGDQFNNLRKQKLSEARMGYDMLNDERGAQLQERQFGLQREEMDYKKLQAEAEKGNAGAKRAKEAFDAFAKDLDPQAAGNLFQWAVKRDEIDDDGSNAMDVYSRGVLELGLKPKAGADSQETYGLSPIWGTNEAGEDVLLQSSNRGGVKQVPLPKGVTPKRGQTSRVDLGTEWGVLDVNGNLIGRIHKDLKGAAAETAIGQSQGELAAAAPGAIVKADQMMGSIDRVLNDPNFNISTGAMAVLSFIPGTPMFDFTQKVKQLQGQAFLQAFESLKGGGQITQIEGEKAAEAIARLNTAQSPKAFREALDEMRGVLQAAKARWQGMVGQPTAPAAAPPSAPSVPPPPPGFVVQ